MLAILDMKLVKFGPTRSTPEGSADFHKEKVLSMGARESDVC